LEKSRFKSQKKEDFKMSQKGFMAFMQKVNDDKALAAKVEAIGADPAKIIALGHQNGCEFKENDLMEFNKKLMEIQACVSDEELEKVAGGVFSATVAAFATVVGAVAGVVGAVTTVTRHKSVAEAEMAE
jgi:predicted ribosomally synthesized peptide with nif11-like leader